MQLNKMPPRCFGELADLFLSPLLDPPAEGVDPSNAERLLEAIPKCLDTLSNMQGALPASVAIATMQPSTAASKKGAASSSSVKSVTGPQYAECVLHSLLDIQWPTVAPLNATAVFSTSATLR